MPSRPRILRAIAYLLLLTTVGAVGFVWLEAMDWSDAIYLSVVTISTVGFGDVVPVTPAGRFFTLGLVTAGVGTALYLVSVIAQDILEGRLRDVFHRSSMMREIKKHVGDLPVVRHTVSVYNIETGKPIGETSNLDLTAKDKNAMRF